MSDWFHLGHSEFFGVFTSVIALFVLICIVGCYCLCYRKKKESNTQPQNTQPPQQAIIDHMNMEFQSERTLSNISTSPTAPPHSDANINNIFKGSSDNTLPTYEEAVVGHHKKL